MRIFKTISIILLISFQSILFAQTDTKISPALNSAINSDIQTHTVWIFFSDKGGDLQNKLVHAENLLSEKNILRRKKLISSSSIVDFYDIPVEEAYINTIRPYIKKIRHSSKWLNAVSAEVDKTQLEKISQFSFVKKIDIVRKAKTSKYTNNYSQDLHFDAAHATYNLDYGASLTQLEQINVPMVHDLGYSGNGITICVLDAGFNYLEHQSFSSINIIDAYDFVNDDDNVDDEGDMGTGSHGTKTLSTIGGFYEGELIGPAYGADYILAKTENTDSETQIEEDNWVAAVEWAELLGVDITSTSLGYIDFDDGTGYSASELDGNTAIITIAGDIAASKGILVVNSAGNEGYGTTTIGAPADGDSVLAVGAVYSDGSRTSFSSCGPSGDGRIKPEVMAMGSGVVVASSVGQYYTTASGTSFSCPLTAGAAALLWEMVPSASNMDIFEALKMTANNADNPNNQYGWGIIDVYAAYEYLALPKIDHIPLSDTEDFNGPYTVECQVSSNYDLINDTPKLLYRKDNGNWNEIVFSEIGDDLYSADIPGDGNPAQIDYYISAENENALIFYPSEAPDEFFTFTVQTDMVAPVIEHEGIAEYYINLWSQAQINAKITDNTQINSDNTYVSWKLNNIEQANIPFTETETDIYTANFPFVDLTINDVIDYQIHAEDNSTSQNTTVFPESGYVSFTVKDRISFEENQFSHNWELLGDENWFINSDEYQHGSFSAKSGDINDNQSSTLRISFTCDIAGDISFFKKVSCEDGSSNNWDYLKFEINGVEQNRWDGEHDWSQETYSINPGTHTLSWVFIKDGSVSTAGDCAWIDNITLPGINSLYTVSFEVNNGTDPIESAGVLFDSQNILTNSNGIADFQSIAPDSDYAYTVSKDGYQDYNGNLSVIDQNVTESITLVESTSVFVEEESDVLIYPNPASDKITVQLDEKEIILIEISDLSGKVLKTAEGNQLYISEFEDGVYLCKIIHNEGVYLLKFIISR
jgi:serine protease AprX